MASRDNSRLVRQTRGAAGAELGERLAADVLAQYAEDGQRWIAHLAERDPREALALTVKLIPPSRESSTIMRSPEDRRRRLSELAARLGYPDLPPGAVIAPSEVPAPQHVASDPLPAVARTQTKAPERRPTPGRMVTKRRKLIGDPFP